MQHVRNRRTKSRRNGPERPLATAATHPPPINPQITHHQRLRFLSNAAGTQVITYANLLDTMLIAVSAIAGYDLFDVVKVKAVEMWCQGVTNAPTTVTCTFDGGIAGVAGSGRQYADTSMGIEPAHVYCRPGKDNGCGLWQGTSALVAFAISVPNETVIDVEVSFRNATVAPVAADNALVGAGVGQIYYRGLDGLAIAGTKFVPQALDTI